MTQPRIFAVVTVAALLSSSLVACDQIDAEDIVDIVVETMVKHLALEGVDAQSAEGDFVVGLRGAPRPEAPTETAAYYDVTLDFVAAVEVEPEAFEPTTVEVTLVQAETGVAVDSVVVEITDVAGISGTLATSLAAECARMGGCDQGFHVVVEPIQGGGPVPPVTVAWQASAAGSGAAAPLSIQAK